MTENLDAVMEDIRALERALDIALADLSLLTRLCNLMLGMMEDSGCGCDGLNLYFLLRSTVHRLQKETLRQAVTLDGIKDLVHRKPVDEVAVTSQFIRVDPGRKRDPQALPVGWV